MSGTERHRPEGSSAAELRAVSKRFEDGDDSVTALDGVDLQVRRGEFVAVMGPSASGKSTLVNVLCGIVEPDAGEVRLAGTLMRFASRREWERARRRIVGVVYQRLNLVPTLSAVENVMLPLELDGMSRADARHAAVAALEQLEIVDRADRLPRRLSGGEQQRVAIARALVGSRSVLLADEPTGAVDSIAADLIVSLLRAQAHSGAAVLMVTHDSRLAAVADRVEHLESGVLSSTRPTSDSPHEMNR